MRINPLNTEKIKINDKDAYIIHYGKNKKALIWYDQNNVFAIEGGISEVKIQPFCYATVYEFVVYL